MNKGYKKGLSIKEVEERIAKGLNNYNDVPKTKSIGEILIDNIFTYFNFLNVSLGLAVFVVYMFNNQILEGLKNCLFLGIVLVNSAISIAEEITSKRIIDNLSVVSESKAIALRDGEEVTLSLEEVVIDDVIKLSMGNQIVCDSVVLEGEIEVNECLVTGESDSIKKTKGDNLLSGSFVVSGNAYAKVVHVGKENYVSKITREAKYKKEINSIMMGSFTKILKILSAMIIPIGIFVFFSQYNTTKSVEESIKNGVAALIGIIPEGLILLTSSVMTVGVIKLYKVNVLVQQLQAIEILARVDTICLDKTGTLTEGRMKYAGVIESKEYTKEDIEKYLKRYVLASMDNNQTMAALKKYFKGAKENFKDKVSFSSDIKWGAIEFDDYSLYLGAPDIILGDNVDNKINDYVEDYRVLALGIKEGSIDKELKDVIKIGYILIEDVIRPSAKETLDYFKNNNVDVKIISGDNVKTVMSIAKKVGLDDIQGIDIGNLTDEELEDIIDSYQVFGRCKPEQKKTIIKYLKSKGHVVAMTGDGVNDVLALKESDCAISVKSGSDAARNVSQLILLNNDFNSLPNVVKEGRQTINNIERSASLLLVKTLFILMLIVYSVVSCQKFFFIPIQLTFITTFTIGTPSFILALEPSDRLVKGNFMLKIFAKSLPTALTVVFNIVLVSIFKNVFNLSQELQNSISVMLTTIVGLYYLFRICYPLNFYRGLLFFTMLCGFLYSIIYLPGFFNLVFLNEMSLLIMFVLIIDSFYIYKIFNYFTTFIFNKFDDTIEVESDIYKIKV